MKRPLIVAVVAAVALIAGVVAWTASDDESTTEVRLVRPASATVDQREQARRRPDAAVRDVELTAAPATVDLGDRRVDTWAFNGTVPGPEIRVTAGDVVRARVINDLSAPLTIHWHGIALRNDMDGVPDLTQAVIDPGDAYVYEFVAPDPGTYFYHPHTGTQLDRGLYAPLIVEDTWAAEADADYVLMLDDWLDGIGQDPDDVFEELRRGGRGAMGGMDMGGHDMGADTDMDGMEMDMRASENEPLGADTGDVEYPLYLVNGRSATAPAELSVDAGAAVRLRIVNAGSDTPFRVAVGGTPLTVVATDGFPVEPVTVDNLLVGMGERYDVTLTAPAAGVTPIVAVAEGKAGQALAVLRTGPGPLPSPDVTPAELAGRTLTLEKLRATAAAALPDKDPDREYRVPLTGSMSDGYTWAIDAPSEDGTTLPVRDGERVRLTFANRSMMWHPIHLHGHTFQVDTGAGRGPRKDTVIVPPMGTVTVELDADNPGQWALHCHNIYHAEAGMVTVLSYLQ